MPGQMRAFVVETVQSWDVSDLWVGCSGNMTIERCLPDLRHHGNDVTLYSSVLGWWASGVDPIPVTLRREHLDETAWLEPYVQDRDSILATVMLGTRFMASMGRDNAYHRRQVQAHKDQWASLHSKTVEKIQRSRLRLVDYACKDVREWLRDDVPMDAAVACFPPFFGGDYEQMFAALEKYLAWPAPSYDMLDEDGKADLIDRIAQRKHWAIGLHHRWDALEDHLAGVVQTTNRGVPIYLYASSAPMRVVAPRQDVERVMTSRLGPDTVLSGSERISLAPLTGGQFATLRSQYMNHKIKPGSPLLALAVLLDGKIAGCVAFMAPDSKFGAHTGYLLSDFPVAPVRYARLSALMVRVAQSHEVKTLLERSLSRHINRIATTAFSDRPASMKYRTGGLSLLSRQDAPDDHWNRYQLQYGAESGRWTLAEAYRGWFDKNGSKVSGRAEAE